MSPEDRLVQNVTEGTFNIIIELLRFLMAHPTHLTVVVCVAIMSRAMVSIMAHTRAIAVETKSIEEQREVREIEADRDVKIANARALERHAVAKLRVATTMTKADHAAEQAAAEREAEAEEEVVRAAKRKGGSGREGRRL